MSRKYHQAAVEDIYIGDQVYRGVIPPDAAKPA